MCYTLCSEKNTHFDFCPYLRQMLTDFQNSFTVGLSIDCYNALIIKNLISPQTRRYTTLSNVMSGNYRQSETDGSFNNKF